MNETTVQLLLSKIDSLQMYTQYGLVFLFAIISILWTFMNRKFEKIDTDLTLLKNDSATIKSELLEIKTILKHKEFCGLKDSNQLKKAE